MVDVGDAVYVLDVAPDIAESDVHVDDVPLYHWYKYGEVPPDVDDVNITFWPLFIVWVVDGVIDTVIAAL